MKWTLFSERGLFRTTVLLLAVVSTSFAVESLAQTSPDGLWTVLEEVEFLPRYEEPSSFIALSLDESLMGELLDGAPP
jgi:hypothetical protein